MTWFREMRARTTPAAVAAKMMPEVEICNRRIVHRMADVSRRLGIVLATWLGILAVAQRRASSNARLPQSILERVALEQLHDDASRILRFFQSVDLCDVWMIERGEQFGFALKSPRRGRD